MPFFISRDIVSINTLESSNIAFSSSVFFSALVILIKKTLAIEAKIANRLAAIRTSINVKPFLFGIVR